MWTLRCVPKGLWSVDKTMAKYPRDGCRRQPNSCRQPSIPPFFWLPRRPKARYAAWIGGLILVWTLCLTDSWSSLDPTSKFHIKLKKKKEKKESRYQNRHRNTQQSFLSAGIYISLSYWYQIIIQDWMFSKTISLQLCWCSTDCNQPSLHYK